MRNAFCWLCYNVCRTISLVRTILPLLALPFTFKIIKDTTVVDDISWAEPHILYQLYYCVDVS